MYAVVMSGGKQYRVGVGDRFKVERLQGEVGDEVLLDRVLMVGEGKNVQVGRPLVAGAAVKAEIVDRGRGPKILVFKKRRRKKYRRKAGHRQSYTELAVTEIVVPKRTGSGDKTAEGES